MAVLFTRVLPCIDPPLIKFFHSAIWTLCAGNSKDLSQDHEILGPTLPFTG